MYFSRIPIPWPRAITQAKRYTLDLTASPSLIPPTAFDKILINENFFNSPNRSSDVARIMAWQGTIPVIGCSRDSSHKVPYKNQHSCPSPKTASNDFIMCFRSSKIIQAVNLIKLQNICGSVLYSQYDIIFWSWDYILLKWWRLISDLIMRRLRIKNV